MTTAWKILLAAWLTSIKYGVCQSIAQSSSGIKKPPCWEILVTSIPVQKTNSNMSCTMCWWEICAADGLLNYLSYSSLIYHLLCIFLTCQEFWLSNIYRCHTFCQITWIVTTARVDIYQDIDCRASVRTVFDSGLSEPSVRTDSCQYTNWYLCLLHKWWLYCSCKRSSSVPPSAVCHEIWS